MKPIDELAYLRVVPVKQAVEDALIDLPGVTGVGVGWKQVGGVETDVMAIRVFVRSKGTYDPANEIPGEVEGVPTDVIECEFLPEVTHRSLPDDDTKRYDPVVGGGSCAPARETYAGTLGVLVRDNATSQLRFLSNWHVLCGDPSWSSPGVDRRITQPAIMDGGKAQTDVIGNVVAGIIGQVVIPFGYDLYVDCALCDLSGARAANSSINRVGTLTGVETPVVGDLVRKYGRSTGFTYGVVQDTNFTISVYFPSLGYVRMYYQYCITAPAPGMPPFTQPGDSGAVVVDNENRAIALHCAGGTSGTVAYSVCNPMYMVLKALNVSLVTS